MGVRYFLGLPLRAARSALEFLFQRHDTRLMLALPAAGLDEATAHTILFALRAAVSCNISTICSTILSDRRLSAYSLMLCRICSLQINGWQRLKLPRLHLTGLPLLAKPSPAYV